jgi:pilus assembly protein CpaB
VLALLAFSMGRRNAASTPAPQSQAQAAPAAIPPANVTHVVVAAQRLIAGEPIPAGALHEVPVGTLPDNSYGQPELLVGQVPRVDIPEGSVITSNLLSNPLAMQLQAGERAIAVPIDEVTGIGARVQPGDFVDVVITMKTPVPGNTLGKEHSESRLLASRLRVLAYGVRDLPNAAGAATKDAAPATPKADPNEAPPRMAVLATPLADVDPLVLGAQSGKLSLALRHPGDVGMPSDHLFPLPAPLLLPRTGLTAEQRGDLNTPENQAYAGLDEAGLFGRSPQPASMAPRPRSAAPSGLEIIRGSGTPASTHNQVAVTP